MSTTIGIKDTSINTGKKTVLFKYRNSSVSCIYDCKKLDGFSIKTAKKIK